SSTVCFRYRYTVAGSPKVSAVCLHDALSISSGFTVSAATASKLAFGQQPTTTTAGSSISPAVTVIVQDQFGNTITGDSSNVTIGSANTSFTSASTLTVAASGGVATFSAIQPT